MTVTFAVGRLIDQLTKTIARYGRVDLLCLDELGYMELDRRGAELLFQVLSEREERSAIAIASNEPFSGWTKTFSDPRSLRRRRGPLDVRRADHRDRHHQATGWLVRGSNAIDPRAADPRSEGLFSRAPARR